MPTANGGKWLSFVDVAIDKGLTTTNIAITAIDCDGGQHPTVVPPWWWWRGSFDGVVLFLA
jgi:hypothetical protein